MNNLSKSDYYDCIDNSKSMQSIEEHKIEPDDTEIDNDDMTIKNYTSDDLTSPTSSDAGLDLNIAGPLNPNNATNVQNASNTEYDTASNCSENYQEIGSIMKPMQRRFHHSQQSAHPHNQNQEYYSSSNQSSSSFPPQMFGSASTNRSNQNPNSSKSTMGGYSLPHHYKNPSSLNYSTSQQQQQQPHNHSQSNYLAGSSYMQQQHEQSHLQYFKQEPIFRPPPTSAYYQNYYSPPPRQHYDYSAIYRHHQQQMLPHHPSHMFWYSQHHNSNSHHSPLCNSSSSNYSPMSPIPGPAHSSRHLHQPQHSQYLSSTATGSIGPPYNSHPHNDQMMNVLQFSNSNGREARNRAEKQRRDKLNGSIADLATMVPHVAESQRRLDKTAVLRYSAHGLRLLYVFGKTLEDKPGEEATPSMLLTESLTKLLDGFLLTMTCRGQIVLITSSVEQHLGHCQTDLFGQNILHITHPDDHQMLKQQLIPTDLDQLLDIQDDENGEPRPRTQEEEEEIDRRLLADKRNFTVRLARATPRSEPTSYEIVKIDGCFRRADSAPRGVKASTFPTGLPLIRRARGRDDSIPLHSISGNDIVLVAMARIIKPPKLIERLREANHFEYKTRHLIDGRMIMVDQRISLVAGYMTDEVTGLSPFTFMHQDDVRWVIVALRQMYDSNSSYGESCYRLLTRTGRFIYLKTRGYLEIDKGTNQVHSFLCINSLLNEEDGRRQCEEMKNKFSIIINAHVPASNTDGLAVDNPQQLEKAVIYLIENLQRTARHVVEADDEYIQEDDSHNRNVSSGLHAGTSGCDRKDSRSNTERVTKSPPLTLIPPNTSSIKSSISKSVSIVNTTAAKNFRNSRAKYKSQSEASNSKGDVSSLADDSSSSSSNSNSIYEHQSDVLAKDEQHQNQRTSFSNSNINLRGKNIENISKDNCNSKSNKSDDNKEKNLDTDDNDIRNILIKTESDEFFSDNENSNDNNNRVPPLPNTSGYYDVQILNASTDNSTSYCANVNSFVAMSSTEYKMTSSRTSSYVFDNDANPNFEHKHADLKRIRNNYEDITLDSTCDSPSKKRLALTNSPIGQDNISTSSIDNDQIFVNTSTVIQRCSNPQEELSQLLPNSFSQIKNSLSHIKTAARELKRQCISYEDSKNQLKEIIDEREKQEELLENIQNEYEAHLLQHQTASPTISDGSISLSSPNLLTSSDLNNAANTVMDFDTDEILQRNINLTNTR